MEQNKIQEAVRRLAERSRSHAGAPAGGKKRGALVVIDQKPPVGDNTTLMLYTVKLRAVDECKPTVFFSPRLSNVQVVNRLISIITGIDPGTIQSGQLNDSEWKLIDEKVPQLLGAPLYVDDTPELTVDELRQKLAGLVKDSGVRMAVVDHMQDLTDGGQPANVHRTEACLKAIAEDLGITIFAVKD